MPEKNLLEQKKNNLMKALNRQGADYVPTMLASSCAEVAWTGQKVTDVQNHHPVPEVLLLLLS